MYGNYLDDAAKIVAEKREENLKFEHARLTAEQKDDLLLKFHQQYRVNLKLYN